MLSFHSTSKDPFCLKYSIIAAKATITSVNAIPMAKIENIIGRYVLPNILDIAKTNNIDALSIISDDNRILIIFLLLVNPYIPIPKRIIDRVMPRYDTNMISPS